MLHLARALLFVGAATILLSSIARADEPKEIKTEKGKAVAFGNITGQPASCSSAPGPTPLPQLKVKPSNGVVLLLSASTNLAATDSCPARQIPSIALIYAPRPDFVGVDTLEVEFDAGSRKLAGVSLRITVVDTAGK